MTHQRHIQGYEPGINRTRHTMHRMLILAMSAALMAAACGDGTTGDTKPIPTVTITPTAPSTTPVITTGPFSTTTPRTNTSETTTVTTTTPPVDSPLFVWGTVERLPSRSLGTGWLAGADYDGATIYVLDSDPSSEALGCEGMPVRFLWSIDPEAGERLPVTGDGVRLSSAWVRASPSGQVVVVGFCEEYVNSITVFDVESPNVLIDGRPVTSIRMGIVPLVRWAGDDLLVASEHPSTVYTGEIDLSLVNVDTGESELLLTRPLGSPTVAVLSEDGHLVAVEGDAVVVRTRSLQAVAEYPGSGFALSADESRIAVVDGPTLSVGLVGEPLTAVVVVPDDGSPVPSMLGEPVWSSDGQWLAFVRQLTHEGDGEVVLVELSGRIVVTGSGDVVLNPFFLPNAVVFTQCGTDGCQIMITDLNS